MLLLLLKSVVRKHVTVVLLIWLLIEWMLHRELLVLNLLSTCSPLLLMKILLSKCGLLRTRWLSSQIKTLIIQPLGNTLTLLLLSVHLKRIKWLRWLVMKSPHVLRLHWLLLSFHIHILNILRKFYSVIFQNNLN